MFKDNPDKDAIIERIINELIDHSVSYAHNRHLSNIKCKEMGLDIKDLESDQKLQEKVLSIHHIYSPTLNSTAAFKIIENNLGTAYIQQAHQVLVQASAKNRGQPTQEEIAKTIFGVEPAQIPTKQEPNKANTTDA